MSAIIRRVVKVEDHPNSDKAHLGVFTLSNGAVCIGVNPSDGVRRFQVDDLVVHVEPGSTIPEWMMNDGFENLKPKGKVKASNFAGVRSEGIMLNTLPPSEAFPAFLASDCMIATESKMQFSVALDADVSSVLGIT